MPMSVLTLSRSVVLPDIFLKSFPVQPEELKDKLFVVNEEDGGLSDEHIASLRRYGRRDGASPFDPSPLRGRGRGRGRGREGGRAALSAPESEGG